MTRVDDSALPLSLEVALTTTPHRRWPATPCKNPSCKFGLACRIIRHYIAF